LRFGGFAAIKTIGARLFLGKPLSRHRLPYLFSMPKISAEHAAMGLIIGIFFATIAAVASRGAGCAAVGWTE
jgi:hypothetical protein